MSIRDQILLWNSASLHITDIRRRRLLPHKQLEYCAPSNLFLILVNGNARLETEESNFHTQDAPVIHVGKGGRLRIESATSGFEFLIILYKAKFPQQLPGEISQPQHAIKQFYSSYCVPAGTEASYRSMTNEMDKLWGQDHPMSRLEVKRQFYAFVQLLLSEMERREEEGGGPEEGIVTAAVRHMQAHYRNPWTLSSLAEQLGTSTRQLQRGFKARFGHSPLEHLIGIRMEQAKILLEESEYPISKIAEAVGYPDSYYFSRLFKKYNGMSPRTYRQCRMQNRLEGSTACRISPAQPSHSIIVPSCENDYHHIGSATQAFRALMALTLMCTGGIAHAEGKIYVPHVRGTLVLEEKPQRIAVLDYQYVDQLLALGIRPVGSVTCKVTAAGLPAELAAPLSGMARLGTKEMPDLRALKELKPDVILCTAFQNFCYEELSAIAPTIMLDRNEDWRQTLLRLGMLFGRHWQALRALDDYNAKLDQLRHKLAAHGTAQTVALIRPRDGSIRLHSEKHRTARLLYDDLGLAAPPLARMQQGTSTMIPLEALPDLRADRLFVLTDDTNREQTRLYQQSPVWKEMNAVRKGQVRHCHTALWIGYYGPLAMSRIVDEIAETLLTPI